MQGLRALGYVEGKNILMEYRYAEGQSSACLTWPLTWCVCMWMSWCVGTSTTAAAKQATSTIPIVVRSAGDLVGPAGGQPGEAWGECHWLH